MITTKNRNGSITVSAIIGDYLVSETYYDYTSQEAMDLFNTQHPSGDGDSDTMFTCPNCGGMYLYWQTCQHNGWEGN